MSASVKRPGRTRASRGRVPDFFIVGHAKSGTTALYEMLRRHPQIYMPGVKEPMFFARNPPSVESEAGRFERTGKRSETLDDYLSLFTAAREDQMVGEASTFYLWSPYAPGRIAAAQPAARIVAILREPASFLYSLHLQMVQNHAETEKDLRAALALESARREGRHIPRHAHWPAALIYSDRVRYVEQLRRYHSTFGPEQVLVLLYDDFRRDNRGTLRDVLRFLDVDDTVELEPVEANPSVRVRSLRVDALERALRSSTAPAGRAARATFRSIAPRRLRHGVMHPLRRRVLYGRPSSPDETLMSDLRHRFRDEVLALSEYLDRDLVTLWGYDHLD